MNTRSVVLLSTLISCMFAGGADGSQNATLPYQVVPDAPSTSHETCAVDCAATATLQAIDPCATCVFENVARWMSESKASIDALFPDVMVTPSVPFSRLLALMVNSTPVLYGTRSMVNTPLAFHWIVNVPATVE